MILGSKAEAPLLLRQCGYGGGGDVSSGWRVGFCWAVFFNFWLIGGGGDFWRNMDEKKVDNAKMGDGQNCHLFSTRYTSLIIFSFEDLQFDCGSRDNRVRWQDAFWVTCNSEFVFHFARREVNGNPAGELFGMVKWHFQKEEINRSLSNWSASVYILVGHSSSWSHLFPQIVFFWEEEVLVTTILQMAWIPTITRYKLWFWHLV